MADRGRGRGRGARPDNVGRGGQGGRGFHNVGQADRGFHNGGQGNRGNHNGGQGGRGNHNGAQGDRVRGAEYQPPQAAGLERQMGRMAMAGPGRAPDRPRAVMTEKEKRDKAFKSYDLVQTRAHNQSKKGTSGVAIQLVANYFGFKMTPDFTIFKYRVDFSDRSLEENTGRKKYLLKDHRKKLPPHVFDGSMIFSTQRLFPESTSELVLTSDNRKRDSTEPEIVQITVRCVGEASRTDHDYIHFFNNVWRSALDELDLKQINRNYFDHKEVKHIPMFRLQIWPGYITTIRQQENQLLVCAEIASKILREDSALECIRTVLDKTRGNLDAARSAMIGSIVVTRYNNDRTYRVDEINFDMTPLSTFTKRDGENDVKVTYKDYFEKRYNIVIRDPNQPMLLSVPKERDRRSGMKDEPVYLVPEMVKMTGLTDEQRSNFKLTQAISEHTRMEPSKRVETLRNFARRITTTEKVAAQLKKFDMEMDTKLVTFNGRVLPAEKVSVGRNVYQSNQADWNQLVQKGISTGATISKWAVVYPKYAERNVKTFIDDNMIPDSRSLGVDLRQPKYMEIPDTRVQSYVNAINACIQMDALFIFVVVPNDTGDVYATVKKKLCIDSPIPSQVVTMSKVLNKPPAKYRSIATKVVVQMATKIKATPWTVQIPFKRAMVVGFDTYHEKDGDRKGASIGALVASYDPFFSQYYSKTTTHRAGTELSNEMGAHLQECLKHFKSQNNGELPTRVFFYRDGVGAGQVQEVNDTEVSAIQKVLKSEELKKEVPEGIKLTFIIVSKRINTRLMTMGPNNQAYNPPSGTVVDDVVTCPERYDFFLVSQSVRQGTVNPTSYNVLVDESGFTPDKIQILTYKLTHLYYNMASTVRVPAPCLYAHKLADLVGKSLKSPAHPRMNEYLYYL